MRMRSVRLQRSPTGNGTMQSRSAVLVIVAAIAGCRGGERTANGAGTGSSEQRDDDVERGAAAAVDGAELDAPPLGQQTGRDGWPTLLDELVDRMSHGAPVPAIVEML